MESLTNTWSWLTSTTSSALNQAKQPKVDLEAAQKGWEQEQQKKEAAEKKRNVELKNELAVTKEQAEWLQEKSQALYDPLHQQAEELSNYKATVGTITKASERLYKAADACIWDEIKDYTAESKRTLMGASILSKLVSKIPQGQPFEEDLQWLVGDSTNTQSGHMIDEDSNTPFLPLSAVHSDLVSAASRGIQTEESIKKSIAELTSISSDLPQDLLPFGKANQEHLNAQAYADRGDWNSVSQAYDAWVKSYPGPQQTPVAAKTMHVLHEVNLHIRARDLLAISAARLKLKNETLVVS